MHPVRLTTKGACCSGPDPVARCRVVHPVRRSALEWSSGRPGGVSRRGSFVVARIGCTSAALRGDALRATRPRRPLTLRVARLGGEWTSTSSGRPPRPRSARRSTRSSTRSSARPAGAGTAATRLGARRPRRARRTQRAGATRPAAAGARGGRRTRFGWVSRGALNHVSAGCRSRPPRRTASRRSTPCSPRRRSRRSSPTSATTSPAGCWARRTSAPDWHARSARKARRRVTDAIGWMRSPVPRPLRARVPRHS